MPTSRNGRHDVLFQSPGEHSGHIMEWLWKLILKPRLRPAYRKRTKVLDMTYGEGVFWRWPNLFHADTIDLHTMDKDYDTKARLNFDWTHPDDITEYLDMAPDFGLVVFDPPFSSIGPSKMMKDRAKRSGADREENGIKNYNDVKSLYHYGLDFIRLLKPEYAVVKSQNVVESNVYRDTMGFIYEHAIHEGWELISMVHQWHRPVVQRIPQRNFDNNLSQWTVWRIK